MLKMEIAEELTRLNTRAKKKATWITKGTLSANECFFCLNKLDHKITNHKIQILCANHCKYEQIPKPISNNI